MRRHDSHQSFFRVLVRLGAARRHRRRRRRHRRDRVRHRLGRQLLRRRPRTSPPRPCRSTEPASGLEQTVGQVYQQDAQGVAYIEAEQEPGGSALALRRAVGRRHRDGFRHPDRQRRPHPHQRPRRRRLHLGNGASSATARRCRRRSSASTTRPTSRCSRSIPQSVDAQPLPARRLGRRQGRRRRDRDRQPLRPRSHRDLRDRLRAAAPDQRSQRLHDLRCDPDGRRDQPRQLRRPADRHRAGGSSGSTRRSRPDRAAAGRSGSDLRFRSTRPRTSRVRSSTAARSSTPTSGSRAPTSTPSSPRSSTSTSTRACWSSG